MTLVHLSGFGVSLISIKMFDKIYSGVWGFHWNTDYLHEHCVK